MRLTKEIRDRTKAFGSSVVRAYIALPNNREEVAVLGKQLLRAATSVASHTREASRARTDSEFCSKLDVLLQEADESQLWLEYLIELSYNEPKARCHSPRSWRTLGNFHNHRLKKAQH